MAQGGVGILPLPPRGPHPEFILPTTTISLWPYTDLSDPRWNFGKRYILLEQDPNNTSPQKLGLFASDGWAAYVNFGCMFLKQVPIQFDGIYPDMGSNFEMFTNEAILEVESLGPIEAIPPKGQIHHQEHWTLIKDIEKPRSEEDVVKHITPRL